MAGAGDCNCSPPQPGRNEGSVTTPDIMEERNLEPPGCKSSPVFQFISSFFGLLIYLSMPMNILSGSLPPALLILWQSLLQSAPDKLMCMFLLPAVMEFNPPK